MESYAALHHVPIINERGRQAFLQVVQEAASRAGRDWSGDV